MKIIKVISSAIKSGLRVITHSPFSDVLKTNEQLTPFGLDANPYPGSKGMQAPAGTSGRGGVIGFFCKYLFSKYGERRMFSTLPDGSDQVTEIYQLNNGAILIRTGIVNGAEKYSMLIDSDGTVAELTPKKTLTGDLELNGDMVQNGNKELNGNLNVNGNINCTGIITAPTVTVSGTLSGGIVLFGGKDAGTHTHPYTDDGNPLDTGPPN